MNRHNYARNLSYYFISMLNLQDSHPNIYQYLKNGGFTASISGLPFSKIPCDQIIETTINRSSKSTGGLSGKTENVGASEKWMRINHIMAALREHLDSVIRKRTGSKNIDCGIKRFLSDENDVKMLSQTLEEWVPNLWTSEQLLVNIATGKEAPQEMVKNVKSLKQIGENAMNEFIARFTFQENNFSQNTYYDSIKKQKCVSFVTNSNKKMSTIAKDENKSFGEIFACFDNQRLDLRQIMNWPVTNKPYYICSEDGKVKANTKSLFRNKLQTLCPVAPTNFAPKYVSASVVDVMRVVRIIPIKGTDPPLYST